jgi:hypothetical protein
VLPERRGGAGAAPAWRAQWVQRPAAFRHSGQKDRLHEGHWPVAIVSKCWKQ